MIQPEMDIDHEWVFLPDDRFLDINQDGEKKVQGGKKISDTKFVFLTDYFDKEQPPPSGNSRRVPQQVVPVSFPLEPRIFKAPESELGKEITQKVPFDFTSTPSMVLEKIKGPDIGSVEADKEVKTQVSFRKPAYNNESVDMTNKMDSPRSTTKGVIPQIDAAGTFNFDDKSEVLQNISSPKKKDLVENKVENKEDDATWEENSGGGLNLWKWSLTGIGAICSFGVAAATFCFIILGSQQRHRQQQQNQKLLFQRYTDDKRMKQVFHHTTKINEAISAVRGVPITRAHITFGGYYDGI